MQTSHWPHHCHDIVSGALAHLAHVLGWLI
ncbi:hypothetical protein HUW46_05798 [Amycolatopsis sp. CA-230715]|nr:hypothetical protein HUW46_05798 [Amycolatopsis sp. CA-230715]